MPVDNIEYDRFSKKSPHFTPLPHSTPPPRFDHYVDGDYAIRKANQDTELFGITIKCNYDIQNVHPSSSFYEAGGMGEQM